MRAKIYHKLIEPLHRSIGAVTAEAKAGYYASLLISSNRAEKVENAVWLAEHIGMFPTDVFLSTLSKLA